MWNTLVFFPAHDVHQSIMLRCISLTSLPGIIFNVPPILPRTIFVPYTNHHPTFDHSSAWGLTFAPALPFPTKRLLPPPSTDSAVTYITDLFMPAKHRTMTPCYMHGVKPQHQNTLLLPSWRTGLTTSPLLSTASFERNGHRLTYCPTKGHAYAHFVPTPNWSYVRQTKTSAPPSWTENATWN